MQPADVGDLARLARDPRPALALRQVARLDAALLGRDTVRDEVAVGPGDAVPDGDLQALASIAGGSTSVKSAFWPASCEKPAGLSK
jgi:hypothetical protein